MNRKTKITTKITMIACAAVITVSFLLSFLAQHGQDLDYMPYAEIPTTETVYAEILLVHESEVIVLTEFFVCTTGNDQNPGTIDSPFATIQHALNIGSQNRPQGAVTIYIREGIYFQQAMINESFYDPTGRDRIVGTEPAFLTLRNFPGETAVIDGTLNNVTDQGQHQMIVVRNSDYIRIYGLTIQNNAPPNFGFNTPAAILVETAGNTTGRSQGVQIINNTILGMDGDTFGMPTLSAPGANGSGIQVYGRSHFEENALTGLLIEGNEVAYGRVGWTENIVLGGNIAYFTIRNNYVHNNNNIGINVIGLWGWITGTGTSPDARLDWNRVRRGVVEGNVVINNIGYGNHAYESCGGASGIYIDGAMDVTVRYNFVSGSSVGVSVGTEPPHARWYGNTPVMAENVRIHHNILANNRQGAVLLGGTFGSFDLDVRYNTMVGRDMVRGASGGVTGVVNINNNWTGREMNRNFFFQNNVIVSFVDAGVEIADPNHVIRYLVSGWNDGDGDHTRAEYLTFEGNVIYGRAINGSDSIDAALPATNLTTGNIRAAQSPIAGMNFVDGIDTGDFTTTIYANGAGANVEYIRRAMESARLPLFEIAMADYRGFVRTLPAANAIMQHLSDPAVRGSIDHPLQLSQVGRNIARHFENEILNMPESAALPLDAPQRAGTIVGILNWAFGYDVDPVSGYGGRLSVQAGFTTDNAYRGIISFGYGNEGDIDFSRVAALDAPWTLGSVRGEPDPNSRYPSVRFFIRVPYYNEVSGRTSFITRGFHTPAWWRGIQEAGAVLEISQADIIEARRNNPQRRYVCSETGSDQNNGSQTEPWATLAHAVNHIWHGDTISIRGEFNEDVVIPIKASGNINNPTTIVPWMGHSAVLNGDISMLGVDNITIRNIDINGRLYVGSADRRELRNFQTNWWDMRSLQPYDGEVYGLGIMRDIQILNTGAEVVQSDASIHAPVFRVVISN